MKRVKNGKPALPVRATNLYCLKYDPKRCLKPQMRNLIWSRAPAHGLIKCRSMSYKTRRFSALIRDTFVSSNYRRALAALHIAHDQG